MKRMPYPSLLAALAGLLLLAGAAIAQEVAAMEASGDLLASPWKREEIENPPAREVKIERADKPSVRKLTRPDPELVAQKFEAVVTLRRADAAPQRTRFPLEVDLERRFGLCDAFINSATVDEPYSVSIARWIKNVPEERRPKEKELAFFQSEKMDRGFLRGGTALDENGRSLLIVTILAPTAEEAEQRARTFLFLLDHGASRHIRLRWLEKREEALAEYRQRVRTFGELIAKHEDLEKRLQDYSGFDQQTLSALQLQRLQLDVDMAGVQARLDACERMLTKMDEKSPGRAQVENSRIAAEIELIGFVARRTKLQELLDRAKAHDTLKDELAKVQREATRSGSRVQSLEGQISEIDAQIKAMAPPPLKDDTITIQEVEWQ